jgi:DNA replication and repair protein RecF
LFNQHYRFISSEAEEVSLTYQSQLNEQSLAELLTQSIEKDRLLERTTTGIHKDELQFEIAAMPMKKFGSQGQQKSFLIALKLAQYSYLQQFKGFKPLLLLDDIFDKLDHHRVRKLMEMVSHHDFGQIFITDTSKKRVTDVFEEINVPIAVFEVQNGGLTHA